ncbi:MAG: hypothetical protein CTY21_11450 [Methylomonas sp.]|nr:MAG: hypothetical protein CTY21_11450 [Methylomonas sp.]
MNRRQRSVIALAGLVLAAMLVFPPFHQTSPLSGNVMRNHGYHFIGDAPRRSSVNGLALLIQIMALGVAAVSILYACRDE